MFEALRKYAVFHGRAARREFWLFFLLFLAWLLVVEIIFGIHVEAVGGDPDAEAGIVVTDFVGVLPLFLPSIAVTVRRLHDLGRSGWWVLAWYGVHAFVIALAFLDEWGPVDFPVLFGYAVYGSIFGSNLAEPALDSIWWSLEVLILLGPLAYFCVRGTRGENVHGPDPLAKGGKPDGS